MHSIVVRLGRVAVTSIAIFLSTGVSAAGTSFSFVSAAGSFIGQGQTQALTPEDGFQMGAFLGFSNTIQFYAIGHNSTYNPWRAELSSDFSPEPGAPSTWWEVAFGIGSGKLPYVGEFVDPPTSPDFSDPFVSFIGNSHASNQTSGSFKILELVIDPTGEITSLAVDFTHFGENNLAWRDDGFIRINSSIPAPAVPELPTATLLLSGLFFGSVISRTRATSRLLAPA